jgi:hypothetical protein
MMIVNLHGWRLLLARLGLVIVACVLLVGIGTGLGSALGQTALGLAFGIALSLVVALPALVLPPHRDSRQSLKSFFMLGRIFGGGP